MSVSERPVVKKFSARRMSEGAGFVVRRPIGGHELTDEEADPFLLLDELGPKVYAPGEFPGAPWHPHRGFDTIMYLRDGEGQHSDSMGNKGILRAGDCQWMTAASGIIHDEGKNHPGGNLHGFQMWVNLPSSHKMDPPKYQDIRAAQIPTVEVAPGVVVKIIAGSCNGIPARVQTVVPLQYLVFECSEGSTFTHEVPSELMETLVAYVFEGAAVFGQDMAAKDGDTLKFGAGAAVSFRAVGAMGLKFLLLAGKPLREPIARHGPFVMNTKAEIIQAFKEYQDGTLVKHKAVTVEFD